MLVPALCPQHTLTGGSSLNKIHMHPVRHIIHPLHPRRPVQGNVDLLHHKRNFGSQRRSPALMPHHAHAGC